MKRPATALLLALALIVGVAGACGGDDESSGSAESGAQEAPSGAPQGAPAGMDEFQSCLEDQGVELPEPGSGGAPPGQDMSAEGRKAFEACQETLPDGAPALGSPPDTQTQ